MSCRLLGFAALFLVGGGLAALAADGPCGHDESGTQVKIAGLDLAQLRCQSLVWQQQIARVTADLVAERAAASIATADLHEMRERHGGAMKWWQDCIAAPGCVAWVQQPEKMTTIRNTRDGLAPPPDKPAETTIIPAPLKRHWTTVPPAAPVDKPAEAPSEPSKEPAKEPAKE